MSFDELSTFVVLVQCGNFTKAAEELYVVQSTVSNRIQSLEQELGVRLVIRGKNNIQLTTEGNVFLNYAKQLVSIKNVALQETHLVNQFDDCLRIACVNWIWDSWVSRIAKQFALANPAIALNITLAHGEEIISMMQKGLYDLAYTSYEMTTFNTGSRPFKTSDIVFVSSPDCLPEKKELTREDLQSLPLIESDLWKDSTSTLTDFMISTGKVFRINCNMLHLAKSFCLDGLGFCFLPKAMVAEELKSGQLCAHPIRNLKLGQIELYMTYNKSKFDSSSLQAWLACADEFCVG